LPLPFFDKGCHAGAFLVGGFCLSRAVRRSGVRSEWVVFALALVLASLFGASDEWHQLSTPGRSGADFFDWLADTAGAILGALASRFFHLIYARDFAPSQGSSGSRGADLGVAPGN
jgi:VanZ family protein